MADESCGGCRFWRFIETGADFRFDGSVEIVKIGRCGKLLPVENPVVMGGPPISLLTDGAIRDSNELCSNFEAKAKEAA